MHRLCSLTMGAGIGRGARLDILPEVDSEDHVDHVHGPPHGSVSGFVPVHGSHVRVK